MKRIITRLGAVVRRVFFWLPSSHASEERGPEAGHDHALVMALTSPQIIPRFRQLRYVSRVLSRAEARTIFTAFALFIISGGVALAILVNERTIRVPVVGGSVTEALIGEPKYINPLDAPANDVDRDLTSLIYSGLFRMNGMQPEPDLAETYTWSADGKTLTITMRTDAKFHNGEPVTADDVQFTIDSIQDPARTSPQSPFFRGVKAVATDARTIQFVMEKPDVTFLTALTVGILPAHIWQDIPGTNARLADINLKPIGSGPYRFASFRRDSRGFIRSYTLERFDQYYGIKPYLKTVVFQFFPDRKQAEDALKGDLVEALAFATLTDAQKNDSTRWHNIRLNLPQETVAFFNLKNKTLSDDRVRQALAGVVDRQEIIDAWHGRAVATSGPYPFEVASSTVVDLDRGRALLDAAGWKLAKDATVRTLASATSSELTFTIITSDQPELVEVAETLKRRWSLLGAKVAVETLEPGELVRRATRERTADVVVTNVLLGPEQDLFAFWWSGQAVDRGLNISGLSDRDVDTALETTKTATTTDALVKSHEALSNLILRRTPAIFLVRPSAPYLVTKNIRGVSSDLIVSRPADRFQDLMKWYKKTGWRWK